MTSTIINDCEYPFEYPVTYYKLQKGFDIFHNIDIIPSYSAPLPWEIMCLSMRIVVVKGLPIPWADLQLDTPA